MLTDLDVIGEWLNGQRVGWTVGLTDRQTDRQTDARASRKFTLEGPTLAISMCYKNTGRGRNDQFKTFELEVDNYLPMIECVVNEGMDGQMDRYADG